VPGRRKQRICILNFHDPAGIHYGYPLADMLHYAKVMADEQVGQVMPSRTATLKASSTSSRDMGIFSDRSFNTGRWDLRESPIACQLNRVSINKPNYRYSYIAAVF